jgi:pyruvate dehydrogenase E2 component (dihydrolipoamide acetyltransferase)
MARIEVPMPQMGESIAEGTVSVWLKKVGDAVERDEPIMEISTDKVDAEIPAPVAGVLAEIVVNEGETVEVGTVVGFIETEAGAAASAAPAADGGVPGSARRPCPPRPPATRRRSRWRTPDSRCPPSPAPPPAPPPPSRW